MSRFVNLRDQVRVLVEGDPVDIYQVGDELAVGLDAAGLDELDARLRPGEQLIEVRKAVCGRLGITGSDEGEP